MNWVGENAALIGQLAVDHVRQSVIAIVLSFVLALPIGWVAWRYRVLRTTLVTATGLLYTIPSLAMLIILPTLLGYSIISELNLVVALTIYGVSLLVRAVVDGLDAVDPDARLAATAMGYGPLRRTWEVDLPLAGPVILAGVRVVAVSTVALATVGILVGVGNLGYLFTNGLQRQIVAEVLTGVVVVVLIALVVDGALVLAGRLLMPWARPSRRARRAPTGRDAAWA